MKRMDGIRNESITGTAHGRAFGDKVRERGPTFRGKTGNISDEGC